MGKHSSSGVLRQRQRGQALIYGLFMLFAGLAGLYFMFNTGQVVRAKTKLVTTADAAAYSGGLMHARALNYNAYINRSLMADEVLIAQAVSMASWASYVKDWSENLPGVHSLCTTLGKSMDTANPYAAIASFVASLTKFGPDYAVACGIMEMDEVKNTLIPITVDSIGFASSGIVFGAEAHKAILEAAARTLHGMFGSSRDEVMQRVADANYAGDGSVVVDRTTMDDWGDFTTRYQDDERTRFKEVAVTAAHTDPFVKKRSWTSKGLFPTCVGWRMNEVRRRGGTELQGFDQWHAVDTQSYHKRKTRWGLCRGLRERGPTAMVQQEAGDDESGPSWDPSAYGGSRSDNGRAHARALGYEEGVAMSYSGLPAYHDLNASWISGANKGQEPILRHAVRVTRVKSDLHTTDASGGQIRTRSDSHIAAYDTRLADGVMAAVSGTETFFERPLDHEQNIWGAKRGQPSELGSLFNPYWHTRLVEGDIAAQWLRQGVMRP